MTDAFKLGRINGAGNSVAISADPLRALAYNDCGLVYAGLGQFELAIADFNQVILLAPRFASGYNNRGSAYREFGDIRKSIDDLARTIGLDPQFALAYYNRALGHVLLEQDPEADRDAARAVALGSNSVRVQEAIARHRKLR